MGNVLSGDERLSGFPPSKEKRSRGIVWIDDHFGYRQASKSQRKEFEERRALYYISHKQKLRQRSQSLGAIFEDLYHSADDIGGSYHGFENCSSKTHSRTFLPRIKLTKNMSMKEFQYSPQLEMFRCSTRGDVQESPYCDRIIVNAKDDAEESFKHCYQGDNFINEKQQDNHFTKNFDECMRRLENIEKEHELMEAGEIDLKTYTLEKSAKRQMSPPAEEYKIPLPEQDIRASDNQNGKEQLGPGEPRPSSPLPLTEDETPTEQELDNLQQEARPISQKISKTSDAPDDKNAENTTGWYSNLKQQFESYSDSDGSKESSCRVTGAMLKPITEKSRSYNDSKEVRHYFSRLVRSNRSLIDEELPDPDKVQNIRAMFQDSQNSTMTRNINKFGGSLQNIHVSQCEEHMRRPKSAQGSRNDFETELGGEAKGCVPACGIRTRAIGTNLRIVAKGETLPVKSLNKKFVQSKWTDTTSLSSGVSSDLSSCDTDAECCSREEIEENMTDDELPDEIDDKHYVQTEALEKIRSFGTSVTYFGGQMIKCSVGPIFSPTTKAILDEISEKYPDRSNIARTFEHFYRKYTENNELRKIKVGRVRSFGQNDMFHRRNILNDTEIELYKNDLETEIGIRKPSGKSQNTLKQKLVKSISAGTRMELFEREVVEKLNEILEAAAEMTRSENENEWDNKGDNGTGDSKEESPEQREETVTPTAAKLAEPSQSQSKELFFSYEKDIFRKERKMDMEFEEFEVCETVAEKMEKLQENQQNYRLTITVNQGESEDKETLEEIIINDQEPMDSLEIYLKKNKAIEDLVPVQGMVKNGNDQTSKDSPEQMGHILVPELQEVNNMHLDQSANVPALNGSTNHSISKWPIETSVMIDIQNKERQTPKLITTGKTIVKTKTRSFKK